MLNLKNVLINVQFQVYLVLIFSPTFCSVEDTINWLIFLGLFYSLETARVTSGHCRLAICDYSADPAYLSEETDSRL